MAAKVSKPSVDYRTGSPHKHCGLCQMFRQPNECTAVEGNIKPTELCNLFKRAFSRHARWYNNSKE